MAIGNSPSIITNNITLYLDAGNKRSYPGSGTSWTDLSEFKNNGILNNGPTFNELNSGSIVFDGSNDYVSTSYDLSWNNTNSVSISMFVKPNTLSGVYPIMGKK